METEERWQVSAASAADPAAHCHWTEPLAQHLVLAAPHNPSADGFGRVTWLGGSVCAGHVRRVSRHAEYMVGSAHAPSPAFLLQQALVLTMFAAFGIGIMPDLLRIYGRRRGGVARSDQIRLALGWSYVPPAAGILLWIPLWIASGGPYNADSSATDFRQLLAHVLYMVIAVLAIWSVVLFVAGLAEVQRFSLWRAIEGTLLMTVVSLVVYFALMHALGWPMGRPNQAAFRTTLRASSSQV